MSESSSQNIVLSFSEYQTKTKSGKPEVLHLIFFSAGSQFFVNMAGIILFAYSRRTIHFIQWLIIHLVICVMRFRTVTTRYISWSWGHLECYKKRNFSLPYDILWKLQSTMILTHLKTIHMLVMLLLVVEIRVSLSNITCLYQHIATVTNKRNINWTQMNVHKLTHCLVAAFNKFTSTHIPVKLMVTAAVPMKRA